MNTFDNHMVEEFDPAPRAPEPDPIDSYKAQRDSYPVLSMHVTPELVEALTVAKDVIAGLVSPGVQLEIDALVVSLKCALVQARRAA